MIKIGIDASRIRQGMTGAGRYAAGVMSALDIVMPDAQFVLYAYRDTCFDPPSSRWRIVVDRHPLWSRIPVTQWMHLRIGTLIASNPVDVFWSPNTFVPKGTNVPSVLTVHDFNHVLVPETLPPVTRYAHRKWMNSDIIAATANIANSKGTAQRMFELLGRQPDAIAYPAVIEKGTPMATIDSFRQLKQAGVQPPFLLTVGNRAPRKNLASAVTALERLRDSGHLLDHQLVMAGPEAWNRGGRSIERKHEWILPLGFIEDDFLSTLYAHAEALLFPSIYEGFGMPVIEARARGCRVVTTDSPELREAGGESAIYTDTSPEGIATGILEALSRPRPLPRSLEYRWEDAAEVMASIFRILGSTHFVRQRHQL